MIYGNKKHPNLEKRVFTDQKLVCEAFLIFLISMIAVLVRLTSKMQNYVFL